MSIIKGRRVRAGLFKIVKLNKSIEYYQSNGIPHVDTPGNVTVGSVYSEFYSAGKLFNGVMFPIQSLWTLETPIGTMQVYGTSFFSNTYPYNGALYVPVSACKELGVDAGYTMLVADTCTGTRYGTNDISTTIKKFDVIRCDYYGELGSVNNVRYDVKRDDVNGDWYDEDNTGTHLNKVTSKIPPNGFGNKYYRRYKIIDSDNMLGEYIHNAKKDYETGQFIIEEDVLIKYSEYEKNMNKIDPNYLSKSFNSNCVNVLFNNDNGETGSNICIKYENGNIPNFHNIYYFTPVAKENIFNKNIFSVIDILKSCKAVPLDFPTMDDIENAYNYLNGTSSEYVSTTNISGKFVVVNKNNQVVNSVPEGDNIYIKDPFSNNYVPAGDYASKEFQIYAKVGDEYYPAVASDKGYLYSTVKGSIFIVYRLMDTADRSGFYAVLLSDNDYKYISDIDSGGRFIQTNISDEQTNRSVSYQLTPYGDYKETPYYVINQPKVGEDHTSRGSVITKSGSPKQEYIPSGYHVGVNGKYTKLDPANDKPK